MGLNSPAFRGIHKMTSSFFGGRGVCQIMIVDDIGLGG